MIMQKYDDKRSGDVKITGQKRTQVAMPHLLDLIFVQIIRPLLRGRRDVGASGNAVGGIAVTAVINLVEGGRRKFVYLHSYLIL